mgnify:CR=1 FL=1
MSKKNKQVCIISARTWGKNHIRTLKEALWHGEQCLTLRNETEWIETVKSGWNLLLDPNNNNLSEIIESFEPPDKYDFIFGKDVLKKMISIIDKIDE